MGNGTYGHAKKSRDVVFKLEVLVGKGLGAVDAGATGAVAVEEIAALDHEFFDLARHRISQYNSGATERGRGTDDSVKLAAFVALGIALGVLGLAGAVLAEVLGGFGGSVCEKLHFDPAEGLP